MTHVSVRNWSSSILPDDPTVLADSKAD